MKLLVVATLFCVMLVVESTEIGKGVAQIPVLSLDGLLNNMLQFKGALAKLTSRVNEMEETKGTLANATAIERRKRIAFEVVLKGKMTVGFKEPLKFDQVALNTGNAYNPKSGIFLVPVGGTYLLWANVMANGNTNFHVCLYREGEQLRNSYTGSSVNYGTATINHVVQLKKGDHVWFADVSGSHTVYGNRNSNYGGILMYA